MKKNLYQSLRDGLASIDETMPEIRNTWTAARKAVWSYVRTTLVVTAVILGTSLVAGGAGVVYAYINDAQAATYDYTGRDTPVGSRYCGRAVPTFDVKSPAPNDGTSMYEWRDHWIVTTTCDGHNPAVSCPPGLKQWHQTIGPTSDSTYRDYICYDIAAPPAPWPAEVTVTPLDNCDLYVRGCGSVELWPLHNGQYWGHWPGGWDPGYGCPPGYGNKVQDFTYEPVGVIRFTCKLI
ncbi:MAG: hypothetical protein K8I04_06850 [Gammaproteobacteria bacterium]|nr:hypothetical protein [Gammaproteobacteria bacterium]